MSYSIEYYCIDLRIGWVLAATGIMDKTFTVSHLKKNSSYVFLLRAENSQGLSSAPIIKSVDLNHVQELIPYYEESPDLAKDHLLKEKIKIRKLETVNSTAVKLTWQYDCDDALYQGIYIRYLFNPNSGGVDCDRTFFRRLFLQEKKGSGGSKFCDFS